MFADYHAAIAQNIEKIIMACAVLHTPLQERYPNLGVAAMDDEDPMITT